MKHNKQEVSIMASPLFVAYGSPIIAIEDSKYVRFPDNLGPTFPRPKANVMVLI